MKILVPIKQVCDPEQTHRLGLEQDGTRLDRANATLLPNPFDEFALEAALRLTEDGRAPARRLGEVTTVTVGREVAETTLRWALAIGASAAVRVDANDEDIDGYLVSRAIAHLARESSAGLVLLGKQSADGDGNEVAQRVAAILNWPQVTCAVGIEELQDETLLVQREVDGGMLRLIVSLPAVVSVDLRIVYSQAVRSRHCPREYGYPQGVRYAALPAIIAAKRRPVLTRSLSELVPSTVAVLRHVAYDLAVPRSGCQMLGSTDELVHVLSNRAEGLVVS